MIRADSILGLFDGSERAGCQKRKNGRTEADDALAGDENRPTQNVGINLVQNIVLLWNATGVDYSLDFHAVLGHAIQNDSCVKSGAFDGREEFILCRRLEVPAKGNSSQVWVHQDRAIAIVPGHAQQARLSGPIVFESLA